VKETARLGIGTPDPSAYTKANGMGISSQSGQNHTVREGKISAWVPQQMAGMGLLSQIPFLLRSEIA